MKNLPYYFLGISTLQALIGMGVGIYMGMGGDFTLAPAHAHNNLLGWVSMAIFGLFYFAVPAVAARRITLVHFWVALVANIVFPIGIGMAVTGKGEILSIVGSLLEVLNMLLFAWNVWSSRAELAKLAAR